MSWFAENRFLSIFLGVLLLLVGISTYKVLDERSVWQTSTAAYQASLAQLSELRGRAPFRDASNLKKIEEQEHEYTGAAMALQARLFDAQRKVKAVDPSAFQGRLRESVSSAISHAREKKVELPKDFYLGFERYEKELPRNEITGLLDWQLTAIESLVFKMIDLNVTAITQVSRAPLPGELAVETAPAVAPLLYRFPVQIGCLAFQDRAQSLLNNLVSSSEFLIIRAVRIENEQRLGPPRTLTAANPDPAAAAPPLADATAVGGEKSAGSLPVIAGTEKLKMQLLLDLVQFSPPADPTAKPGKRPKI